MPVYDFKCSCGSRKNDMYFNVEDLPRTLPCNECGKDMEQAYDNHNLINFYAKELYGYFHPQFHCVIESYEHLQRLKKQYGVEEASDPIGGNRSQAQEARHEQWKEQQGHPDVQQVGNITPDGDVDWGDNRRVVRQDSRDVTMVANEEE